MTTESRLKDLCELVVDCPHSTPKWTDSGIVVLRSQNIRNGKLSLTNRSYTDEDHYRERTKRAVPKMGDIVITREAPMGEVCMLPDGLRCCLGQRMVLLRPNDGKIVPRFLLFALQSRPVQAQILVNEGTGSTVSNLRIPFLEDLAIPLPPLPEQRAIAHILGTLDDKIELNRRMNETLESIARALFKSWFVDFDPVLSKAEGRQPVGMDAETAALFPDSFQESELGLIPMGWTVEALGKIGLNAGKSVDPSEVEADTPYVGLDHVPRLSLTLSDWGTASEVGSGKSAFVRGDILFGKLRPYFHKVVVAPTDGLCSTDILVLRPRVQDWFGYFTFHASSAELVAYTDARSTGTRMPRTNWKDISAYLVALPPQKLASQFNSLAVPIIERLLHSVFETKTLASIRDSLLPRLISGELRVPDAEKLLAESPI